jgi:hypothetical protein
MARIETLDPRRFLLHVGGRSILVEIARTPTERWLGLSGRDGLDEDRGMVFVFPTVARHSFWMRGVPFRLTIAFIRDDGTIAATRDLEPLSEATVSSPEPIRLALEVPRGWFSRHGIKQGDRVTFVGEI